MTGRLAVAKLGQLSYDLPTRLSSPLSSLAITMSKPPPPPPPEGFEGVYAAPAPAPASERLFSFAKSGLSSLSAKVKEVDEKHGLSTKAKEASASAASSRRRAHSGRLRA